VKQASEDHPSSDDEKSLPDGDRVSDRELNQYLHQLPTGATYQLPGHISKLAPGAKIVIPEPQPGDLQTVPNSPGVYCVEKRRVRILPPSHQKASTDDHV
jgi:hypothetical protein